MQDLVLDFTHTYRTEWVETYSSLRRLDCSHVEGTDMYCTPEAEQELADMLESFPAEGIHFLDSGNYHYMTRLFTGRIGRPYQLVLFDNHTDMQPTMIPELISCGAWAKHVLEEDDYLERLFLIGPARSALDEIETERREKLVCISREELEVYGKRYSAAQTDISDDSVMQTIRQKQQLLKKEIPVYLSIDKDVLCEEAARTNWDQGQMRLSELMELLQWVCRQNTLLGVDICGELPEELFGEAGQTNEAVNSALYEFFYLLRQ